MVFLSRSNKVASFFKAHKAEAMKIEGNPTQHMVATALGDALPVLPASTHSH